MIFDTHCHYNLDPLYQDWQKHWQKAQAHGVQKTIVVGTNLESSRRAIEITAQEPNLMAAIGIHPSEKNLADQTRRLEELISEEVVAIGETGLDYFRLDRNLPEFETTIQAQKLAFINHIKLANQHQLDLIIHVRDKKTPETPTPGNAYWDTIQILENHPSQQKFTLHCVSGPTSYIKKAIQLGAYFGIAGNITYKNADHLRDLVRIIPSEKRVLETDAPYLAPQKYRGQVCEPWMIVETDQVMKKFAE